MTVRLSWTISEDTRHWSVSERTFFCVKFKLQRAYTLRRNWVDPNSGWGSHEYPELLFSFDLYLDGNWLWHFLIPQWMLVELLNCCSISRMLGLTSCNTTTSTGSLEGTRSVAHDFWRCSERKLRTAWHFRWVLVSTETILRSDTQDSCRQPIFEEGQLLSIYAFLYFSLTTKYPLLHAHRRQQESFTSRT